MRILIGHNRYRFFGGEDTVVSTESSLLKEKGNEIFLFERSNQELDHLRRGDKMRQFLSLAHSKGSYRQLSEIIDEFRPEVAHFHNLYYMLTPSVYDACQDQHVPVVQSLHNFRLTCVNGLLFRNGHVCEDCLDGKLLPGVIHSCYRNSFFLSAMISRMNRQYRKDKIWQNKVDKFIAASLFAKEKFVAAGLPPDKIEVKPNFIHPDPGPAKSSVENYVLYAGRLSREKGVDFLIRAWKDLKNVGLRIAGEGPLEEELKRYVKQNHMINVSFEGFLRGDDLKKMIKSARLLVVPSVCYENFPRIIVEAFALGVPVMASQIGSLKEIIEENRNGLTFRPGNHREFVEKVKDFYGEKETAERLGLGARQSYEQKYTGEINYRMLKEIYLSTIEAYEKD